MVRRGGIVIKDSQGQGVENFINLTTIFLRLGNHSFSAPVNLNGFQISGWSFFHTTNECSGTRYLSSFRSSDSFTAPSQKATGVNPWMNARWVSSVALAKGGCASEGSTLRSVW